MQKFPNTGMYRITLIIVNFKTSMEKVADLRHDLVAVKIR